MRVPLSWLGELVDLAPGSRGADVAASLVSVGLEEEALHGGDITGPLVVGRVLAFEEQIQKNGKPIRFCTVDVGNHGQRVTDGIPQEIVCGATNFEVGDLVVVVLPGALLAAFCLAARRAKFSGRTVEVRVPVAWGETVVVTPEVAERILDGAALASGMRGETSERQAG